MSARASLDHERPANRFGVHALLAFVAVFLAAVPFGLLVLFVRDKARWLTRVDLRSARVLHDFDERHRSFTTAMKVISNSGATLTWIVVLGLVVLWLVYRKLYRLSAFVVVTAAGSSLLNGAIKSVVGRTRPVLVDPIATATGNSFPSGHAQAATVCYGILLLVFLPALGRRLRLMCVGIATVMVLLIGFSRVALGVHYVSDVVGGFVVGAAWLIAMTAAFSAWRRDLRKPPVHPREGLEPEHAERLGPG